MSWYSAIARGTINMTLNTDIKHPKFEKRLWNKQSKTAEGGLQIS